MRGRGICGIDGWTLKMTVAFLFVLSFIANISFLFRAQTNTNNKAQLEKRDFRTTIDRITSQAAESFDIFNRGSSRVFMLDSLLNCVLDKLDADTDATLKDENVTGRSMVAPGPTLHTEKLKKMNDRMLKLLKFQESAMAFLSEPVAYPHEFTYSHNPSTVFSETRDIEILFVVPSAPENFKNRERVRTGGRGVYCRNPENKAKLLFFLGMPAKDLKGMEVQKNISREAEIFGDIVQEDFLDNYSNITLKAISMLKWASTFCQHAKFVFRTDDDIRAHVTKAVKALRRKEEELKNFILGHIRTGWAPIREPKSKYYMSKEVFPSNVLPDFALGAMMAYPISTAKLLYQAALRVRRLPLDDIYITALCASKVGVPLVTDSDLYFKHWAW